MYWFQFLNQIQEYLIRIGLTLVGPPSKTQLIWLFVKEYWWSIYIQFLICDSFTQYLSLPWCLSGKKSAFQCRRLGFDPWVRKILWRRKWQPTLVFLPGKSHGQRNLMGCSLCMHAKLLQWCLILRSYGL